MLYSWIWYIWFNDCCVTLSKKSNTRYKRKLGEMSSSACARWKAAAVTKHDSPQKHFEDTIKASSGLSNESAVKVITEEARCS